MALAACDTTFRVGSFCPRVLAQGLTALARAIIVLTTSASAIWKYSTAEID
jgi:hypothetical protein